MNLINWLRIMKKGHLRACKGFFNFTREVIDHGSIPAVRLNLY